MAPQFWRNFRFGKRMNHSTRIYYFRPRNELNFYQNFLNNGCFRTNFCGIGFFSIEQLSAALDLNSVYGTVWRWQFIRSFIGKRNIILEKWCAIEGADWNSWTWTCSHTIHTKSRKSLSRFLWMFHWIYFCSFTRTHIHISIEILY